MADSNSEVFLSYSLYSDAARTVNWGDGYDTGIATGTGTGDVQTIPIFGRVGAGQPWRQGAYGDTVTVTVTY
jgi:spore coat protein U-like protein